MPALLAAVSLLATTASPAASTAAGCPKTFTAPMIERAIDATFSGTRDVSSHTRRHLRHYITCRRRHVSRARMLRHWRADERAWRARRNPPMLGPVLASYYTLGGGGACGVGDVQSGYRFASLFLACGETIRMCHGSSCVDAQSADRGPYVGGRTFDLNVSLRDALGCGDLCYVTWRRL